MVFLDQPGSGMLSDEQGLTSKLQSSSDLEREVGKTLSKIALRVPELVDTRSLLPSVYVKRYFPQNVFIIKAYIYSRET